MRNTIIHLLYKTVVVLVVVVPLVATALAIVLLWQRAVHWSDLALPEEHDGQRSRDEWRHHHKQHNSFIEKVDNSVSHRMFAFLLRSGVVMRSHNSSCFLLLGLRRHTQYGHQCIDVERFEQNPDVVLGQPQRWLTGSQVGAGEPRADDHR